MGGTIHPESLGVLLSTAASGLAFDGRELEVLGDGQGRKSSARARRHYAVAHGSICKARVLCVA